MMRTTKITVIGAGLGGMTVAGLLQRRGFCLTVYEQTTAFSRTGAGIHLSPNVMLVMRRLGIEKVLSDITLHPDAFVSRQWDTGAVLFELPFDPASEARYGAAYINVHRGDLHSVLEIGAGARHIRVREEAVAYRKFALCTPAFLRRPSAG
ncbi:MAG TPA: FAD-dependent monooxygenase [Xanthobacteraceae bacterium]|nr:FAD-dependent monooxygenase [Xanthobacteraceae bacterium]